MENLRIPDLSHSIQQELENKFLMNRSGSLEMTWAQVESHLLDLLKGALINELRLELTEKEVFFKSLSTKRFLFNNEIYEIKITEYASNDSILQVAIRCLNCKASKLIKRPLKARIDSLGRYATLQIFIDRALLEFQSAIREVCVVVLEAGYRWLAEYVKSTLDEFQNQIAVDLYSYLRQLFSEALVQNIFLFGIADKSGIYLLDDLGRRLHLSALPKEG